jgi:hypothetical protein
MRVRLRRIGQDIRGRRNVDAYVVSVIAFAFAVLSIVGDAVSEDLRWAALLAGVGLLVYRITIPERTAGSIDDLLQDRSSFEDNPLPARLRTARELWVFAPSGVNLLAADHCETLRRTVLQHADGVVRIVVLDPTREDTVRLAVRQLDDSLDYPIQDFVPSLNTVIHQLKTMARWRSTGSFEFRLLDYNPGFSLVAIDPSAKHGTVIVEFHAFHNDSTASRMHLELTRADSEHWYAYWTGQFDHIWQASRPQIPASDG